MKKFIKNNILGFIIGVALMGTITVVYAISSNSVGFVPNDETWDVSTVDEALNDLYESASIVPEISYGTTLYSSYTGNAGSHTQTLSLSKGEYVVAVVYEYGMLNQRSEITAAGTSEDIRTNLTCSSNNCAISKISGKFYHPVASTDVITNRTSHDGVHLALYRVKINENTDTISTSLTLTWSSDALAGVVAIQAIPISY